VSVPPEDGGRIDRRVWRGHLEDGARPPDIAPEQEPPETAAGRETTWTDDHTVTSRDMTPAVGARGGPAAWQPAEIGAEVALARPGFGDARWSFLYRRRDTDYAAKEPAPGQVAEVNRRMRATEPGELHGPFIKPPVWTWEVPLYFWVGGVASGSAFVAAACDLAGDHRSARTARVLALGVVSAAPPLLIADLGRPARFLNMLRIIKPRSPMNMGAWCLVAFSATAAGGVAADLLRQPRIARTLGAATAGLGGYLGSYTGVLLATTAVPVWARSRSVLGPIFICTATASGAAAARLTLVARGIPDPHPTRVALGNVETASIVAELLLSQLSRRRLGAIGDALHQGRAGRLFRAAEIAVTVGVSTRLIEGRTTRRLHDLASALYLLGALGFRYAWVEAGKASAVDHRAVAAMARGRRGLEDATEVPRGPKLSSRRRTPSALAPATRAWTGTVRRFSLGVERLLTR
jgi:formate-dependent nitrite reductase membrane component NrfD